MQEGSAIRTLLIGTLLIGTTQTALPADGLLKSSAIANRLRDLPIPAAKELSLNA